MLVSQTLDICLQKVICSSRRRVRRERRAASLFRNLRTAGVWAS